MRRALLATLLLVGCQEPPKPAPAPPPPQDVVVRGADGVPVLTLKEAQGLVAVLDLAGQVVGVKRPGPGGFRVTDRFDAELCAVTRAGRGFDLRADGGGVKARESGAGVVLEVEGGRLTLRGDGARDLRIARTAAGYDVVREASTVFSVEGPLASTAALALALGELPFPTRACLMLALDELD
jgi:hypothetical protein